MGAEDEIHPAERLPWLSDELRDELYAILNDKKILDLEKSVFESSLTRDQIIEYLSVSDELIAARGKIIDLALRAAKDSFLKCWNITSISTNRATVLKKPSLPFSHFVTELAKHAQAAVNSVTPLYDSIIRPTPNSLSPRDVLLNSFERTFNQGVWLLTRGHADKPVPRNFRYRELDQEIAALEKKIQPPTTLPGLPAKRRGVTEDDRRSAALQLRTLRSERERALKAQQVFFEKFSTESAKDAMSAPILRAIAFYREGEEEKISLSEVAKQLAHSVQDASEQDIAQLFELIEELAYQFEGAAHTASIPIGKDMLYLHLYDRNYGLRDKIPDVLRTSTDLISLGQIRVSRSKSPGTWEISREREDHFQVTIKDAPGYHMSLNRSLHDLSISGTDIPLRSELVGGFSGKLTPIDEQTYRKFLYVILLQVFESLASGKKIERPIPVESQKITTEAIADTSEADVQAEDEQGPAATPQTPVSEEVVRARERVMNLGRFPVWKNHVVHRRLATFFPNPRTSAGGSHRNYINEAGQVCPVAYHRGKDIYPNRLKGLFTTLGLDPEVFYGIKK